MKVRGITLNLLGALAVVAPAGAVPVSSTASDSAQACGYIVEGRDTATAVTAVRRAGGRITHEPPIVNGVSADLTPRQVAQLREVADLQLIADALVTTQAVGTTHDIYQRAMVGPDQLAAQGFFGNGITVAVLDSGLWYSHNNVKNDLNGTNKILAMYDAIVGKLQNARDDAGHGSHIATIIGSPDVSVNGQPPGIAPMARLGGVKAFDGNGSASYATVINGLNWTLANKAKYNIRILNLSFGARGRSRSTGTTRSTRRS